MTTHTVQVEISFMDLAKLHTCETLQHNDVW